MELLFSWRTFANSKRVAERGRMVLTNTMLRIGTRVQQPSKGYRSPHLGLGLQKEE